MPGGARQRQRVQPAKLTAGSALLAVNMMARNQIRFIRRPMLARSPRRRRARAGPGAGDE